MIPLQFQTYIGGYFGPSFDVELQEDGRLAYSAREGEKEAVSEILSVEHTVWAEFRSALEYACVRDWADKYNSPILDGTQWGLEIAYTDWQKKCHGSNNYPPSGQFEIFLQAVRKLTGGRPFE